MEVYAAFPACPFGNVDGMSSHLNFLAADPANDRAMGLRQFAVRAAFIFRASLSKILASSKSPRTWASFAAEATAAKSSSDMFTLGIGGSPLLLPAQKHSIT